MHRRMITCTDQGALPAREADEAAVGGRAGGQVHWAGLARFTQDRDRRMDRTS